LIDTVEQDRISLKNGCVCCSLNEDLVTSVKTFASSENQPDAILIEASGVSDPRALDSSLGVLESAGIAFVDTNVYVLDADAFGGLNYEDSELIIDHAAAADLVLLNKCDLTNLEKLISLEITLSESAPYADILQTKYCNIPIKLILSDKNDFLTSTSKDKKSLNNDFTNHEQKYSQLSLKTTSFINRERFNDFVKVISNHCFRSKGFLRFSDEPNELISFNLVGLRVSYEKLGKRPPLSTQLVMIGLKENIDEKMLIDGFNKTNSSYKPNIHYTNLSNKVVSITTAKNI